MLPDEIRNFETFDQLLDLVGETGGARPVHHSMIESQREGDDLDCLGPLSVRRKFAVRAADKEGPDRWRDDNRRRRLHPERAQAADHNRRVHRVDPPAPGGLDGFVVTPDEIGPGEGVCVCNHRGREAIVDPEITHREVISRIASGEYRNISFIHEIADSSVDAVTAEILAEAAPPELPEAAANL